MANGIRRTRAVAWFVTGVLPPLVAGKLGTRFIAHHPFWAVVIAVGYEALVLIGGFLTVVARKVSSRWQALARLADRVDLFLQRKGPRFERQYRRFVLGWVRFTDTKPRSTA